MGEPWEWDGESAIPEEHVNETDLSEDHAKKVIESMAVTTEATQGSGSPD